MKGPLAARLMARVLKEPTSGCWLWTGAVSPKGYGRIGREGGQFAGTMLVHRASWQIHNGPIPDGLFVLHHYDTPPCVNPAHLFLGNNADNMCDSARKGRICGTNNHSAKLTVDNVHVIRKRLREGVTQQAVANEFGVGRTTIEQLHLGRAWGWVPAEVVA